MSALEIYLIPMAVGGWFVAGLAYLGLAWVEGGKFRWFYFGCALCWINAALIIWKVIER